MLSNQIMELQEQLKNNQTEVQRLTTLITESVPVKNKLNNSNSLKKGEGCYVVIKSFRSEDKAGEWVKKNNTESVRIIRNIGKTWYHIVLDNPVSVSDAGKIVYNKRQNGFPDAWWKTAEYFE
jgi:hypothetical protein